MPKMTVVFEGKHQSDNRLEFEIPFGSMPIGEPIRITIMEFKAPAASIDIDRTELRKLLVLI